MSKFAVLFLLVFFGGIGAAIFYSGFWAFVVYQLVYFLNPDDRWWSAGIPGLRYSFVTVILMLGILAKNYKQYTEASPWNGQPTLKWIAGLLIIYYVAYLFALNGAAHDRFTFDFTKRIVIIFIAYKIIDSEKALDACMWAYLVGCTYIGYLATITGRNSGDRVEGIGMVDSPDSNGTAAALVPAAVMLMYFAWQYKLKGRMVAGFMGAFIANGLVLINSRGAFLGVVASLGMFLMAMIFSRHQGKGQRGTAILMIIVGLSGALYVTDAAFWERMGTLKEQSVENTEASGAKRVQFWLVTFDMLDDRPWGLGIGGYNKLAPLYMSNELRGGVEHRSVHSMWFQGLSEVGWPGFIVFMMILVSLYRMSAKAKKFVLSRKEYSNYFKILALECALMSFLVAGTFINRFRAEVLYWMILFLALAIKIYYLQRKDDEPSKKKRRKPRRPAPRLNDDIESEADEMPQLTPKKRIAGE